MKQRKQFANRSSIDGMFNKAFNKNDGTDSIYQCLQALFPAQRICAALVRDQRSAT